MEKEHLSDICRKGTIASLLELSKFMHGKKVEGYRTKLCQGFVEHHKQNIAMRTNNERQIQQELNKFTIFRTAFHEHINTPYIPGSAIKGALRTAYLNALAKIDKSVRYDNPQRNRHAAQDLEKGLLRYDRLEKDPFRLLKVSDFIPVEATTRIIYAVNEKKKPSKFSARGPYQILEVIEKGSVFTGTITVEDRHTKEADIKRPFALDALLKSALLFYGNEKQREDNELNAADLPSLKIGKLEGAVPLRIGRHSGAESITIEGHRDIKILGNRGQKSFSKTGATTFWLASDVQKNWKKEQLQPFGWVALGEISEEMYKSHERTIKENQQRLLSSIQEHIDEGSPESVKSVETKTVIVQSPLEKLLNELKGINANDAGRIGTVIQKIEQLETVEDKSAAAMAIRDKLGAKTFKKHKRKDYLESLIQKS